jgi:uncharacterized protein YggE
MPESKQRGLLQEADIIIKGIKTINIQSSIPSVPLYRAETFAKSLNEVPIEQGTMKISVSVFVVFNFE